MWSIAGVVTRHLEAARGFEVTFWRSAFNALALVVLLALAARPGAAVAALRGGGRALWLVGAVLGGDVHRLHDGADADQVANVLVTMALGPLFTALLARAVARPPAGAAHLGRHRAGRRRHRLDVRPARSAAATRSTCWARWWRWRVPLAAAVNWTLLQHLHQRPTTTPARHAAGGADRRAAVGGGHAAAGAAASASAHDLALLALLGVVQLAIPCLMAVAAARVLTAPEISLLGLLEVVFGVLLGLAGRGRGAAAAGAGRRRAGAGGAGGQRAGWGCANARPGPDLGGGTGEPVRSCSGAAAGGRVSSCTSRAQTAAVLRDVRETGEGRPSRPSPSSAPSRVRATCLPACSPAPIRCRADAPPVWSARCSNMRRRRIAGRKARKVHGRRAEVTPAPGLQPRGVGGLVSRCRAVSCPDSATVRKPARPALGP